MKYLFIIYTILLLLNKIKCEHLNHGHFENNKQFAIQNNTGPFSNIISPDHYIYKPERNRYHLYISLGCPFACRALMALMIKGLDEVIDYSVVDYYLHNPEGEGWRFKSQYSSNDTFITNDKVNNFKTLKQVYLLSNKCYTGKVTVPVLFDKKTQTIVNNDSGEIIKILNGFNDNYSKFERSNGVINLTPSHLESKINQMNEHLTKTVNLGVYNAGYAETQKDYDYYYEQLFKQLNQLELQLSNSKYLFGNQITETDLRLFSSLIRFDVVYYGLFKCNKKQLKDYPNLTRFTKDIYQLKEIKPTINFKHIKGFYYLNTSINKYLIIPQGPNLNYLLNNNQ